MSVRWFLVGLVAAVLWVWGPRPLVGGPLLWGWFWGWYIVYSYLVGLSAATWFILRYIWQKWQPAPKAEAKVAKVNAALLAIACFITAGARLGADVHKECLVDLEYECLEYATVPGPDIMSVLGYTAVGVFAVFWVIWRSRNPVVPAQEQN